MDFTELVALSVRFLEGAGVVIIVGGIALVTAFTFAQGLRARSFEGGYQLIRRRTGLAIMLGLEVLVGADIIRTIAEEPTVRGVAVLGAIIVIRTFLSFTLEVELEGRWPWQSRPGRAG